jgi:aspartate/glutamate racemase
MISEKRLNQIITEEISKTDVENIVSRKLDSNDFKKSVKEIVADVIEDLYRTLWNRSSTWRGGVTR